MTNAVRYPKLVTWSAEDEGFIATAPDLPGCSAFGATEAEALSELDHAIDAWKEAAASAGNDVPVPNSVSRGKASGKVLLRLPKSLHHDLLEAARGDGVSLNQHLVAQLGAITACRSSSRFVEQGILEAVANAVRGLYFEPKGQAVSGMGSSCGAYLVGAGRASAGFEDALHAMKLGTVRIAAQALPHTTMLELHGWPIGSPHPSAQCVVPEAAVEDVFEFGSSSSSSFEYPIWART